MTKKIIVIGAGFSGLSCASRLKRAGYMPVVLEARPLVGGNVCSDTYGEFLLEKGPNSIIASAQDVFTWINELGLLDDLQTANPNANKRYVVRGGMLHLMPMGAWSFLTTRLLSFSSKCMLMSEPLRTSRGDNRDTAQKFFERRFGKEAARVLAGAFISGVYAGDPARLSASAAFPLFWRFEKEHGGLIRGAYHHLRQREKTRRQLGDVRRKGLYSMKRGLGTIAERAADILMEQCLTATPVAKLERECGEFRVAAVDGRCFSGDAVVVATPPLEAAEILRSLSTPLAESLLSIQMAPVTVLHLAMKVTGGVGLPDGYGFLAPRGEGVRSLGILFSSSTFTNRAPAGFQLLTVFIGGMMDVEAMTLDDAALLELVVEDLTLLLKRKPDLSLIRLERHLRAVPQLMLGHERIIAKVDRELSSLPGLFLAGNYLRGVGIKDAVGSGFAAAAKASEYIGSKS